MIMAELTSKQKYVLRSTKNCDRIYTEYMAKHYINEVRFLVSHQLMESTPITIRGQTLHITEFGKEYLQFIGL